MRLRFNWLVFLVSSSTVDGRSDGVFDRYLRRYPTSAFTLGSEHACLYTSMNSLVHYCVFPGYDEGRKFRILATKHAPFIAQAIFWFAFSPCFAYAIPSMRLLRFLHFSKNRVLRYSQASVRTALAGRLHARDSDGSPLHSTILL